MIRVFTKRYSQTDCIILLKVLYLALGSSKEFCTNMGFFVQSQIYHLQLSVILFRCVTFFAVFHSPHKVSRNCSYKVVDNKSQNYMQSNNIMSNIWCLLSFRLQTLLKLLLLLIVTYTIKHFQFFTKIYHCFPLFHRKKKKAVEVCWDTG